MNRLTFLIDTNILIPLEPTSHEEFKPDSELAIRFVQLCHSCHCGVYIHPFQQRDIDRDKNENRKDALRRLSFKYPALDPPPLLSRELENILGFAVPDSNDWVDNNLLAAVKQGAVHFLVSQDRKIHSKAVRAQLENRVLDVDEAINYLLTQTESSVPPTPAVQIDKAYNLNTDTPFFLSLKQEYPGFEVWMEKCKAEKRTVFIIPAGKADYAGLAILNREEYPPQGLTGKVLKICTLKVSENHLGQRYGELLLKNVFAYAFENKFDWTFVELYPRHRLLVDLLDAFGFEDLRCDKENGEKRFAKPVLATDNSVTSTQPFEFNRRHGPPRVMFDAVPLFVVPIQPRFDELLFPERQAQGAFFAGKNPFGNSIRKAYLCNAKIRKMQRGDLLAFYRSSDEQALSALGIVENTLVSSDVEEIVKFVGKITVYGRRDIEILCQRETLAILFRQVIVFRKGINLEALIAAGVLNGPPQSIVSISENGKSWLKNQLRM